MIARTVNLKKRWAGIRPHRDDDLDGERGAEIHRPSKSEVALTTDGWTRRNGVSHACQVSRAREMEVVRSGRRAPAARSHGHHDREGGRCWAPDRRAPTRNVGGRSRSLMDRHFLDACQTDCQIRAVTQDDIDNGRLVCVIGVAPVKPAEFVVFRIRRSAVLQATSASARATVM